MSGNYLHKDKLICASCGKRFERYNTPAKKKIVENYYCSIECRYEGWRKNKVPSVCDYCGTDFLRKPDNVEYGKRRNQKYIYCSIECRHRGREVKRINLVCRNCNTVFAVRLSDWIREYKIHGMPSIALCSNQCRYQYKTKLSLIDLECVGCGNIFQLRKCDIKSKGKTQNDNFYCSLSCCVNTTAISSIEKKVQAMLLWHGIKYKQQAFFYDKNNNCRYAVDFYFRKQKTILEINGTYWHADPRKYNPNELNDIQQKRVIRDQQLADYCNRNNINLITIWEKEIREDPHKACLDALSQITDGRKFRHVNQEQLTLASA